jgi:hypothetical protein
MFILIYKTFIKNFFIIFLMIWFNRKNYLYFIFKNLIKNLLNLN